MGLVIFVTDQQHTPHRLKDYHGEVCVHQDSTVPLEQLTRGRVQRGRTCKCNWFIIPNKHIVNRVLLMFAFTVGSCEDS